jgi:hypothetical protein
MSGFACNARYVLLETLELMEPDVVVAGNMFFCAVLCGVLAVVAPWIGLWFNRWAAAIVAGLLAFLGTILECISNSHIPRITI